MIPVLFLDGPLDGEHRSIAAPLPNWVYVTPNGGIIRSTTPMFVGSSTDDGTYMLGGTPAQPYYFFLGFGVSA